MSSYYVKLPSRVVEFSVVDGDLTGTSVQLAHNLGTDYPSVTVYNSSKVVVIMGVTSIDANTIEVDFNGYTPLTGTWIVTVRK